MFFDLFINGDSPVINGDGSQTRDFTYIDNVIQANDGTEALAALEQVDPDIILLDVMMPLKNGFEVCHEVKQNTKLNHIPVLILTATTQTSSKTDIKEIIIAIN